MMFLWLPLGLAAPTLSGWCVLGILEGRHPVLHGIERWILGFALGLLLTTFIVFFASVVFGFPLTFSGYLGVQLGTLIVTGSLRLRAMRRAEISSAHLPSFTQRIEPLSITAKILLVLLALWTFTKIAALGFDLLTTPSFFNDTITNWNARAKVFFTLQQFSLHLPSHKPGVLTTGGISSYPPSVPLVKAWLATFAGEWNEGLVNSIHGLWYLALAAIIYFSVRRYTSFVVAALGTYVFISLPLVLLHGAVSYGDIFMALHLFIPAILLFHALRQDSREAALSFLRISAFAIALVPFTKNEGLLLYFPPLLASSFVVHGLLLRRSVLSKRDILRSILWTLFSAALVLGVWLSFKWIHGLEFGNAKPISGVTFAWQPGVLEAVAISLFFHGSWLLLFPLLLFLLITQWRTAFFSNISFLTVLFLVLFSEQLFLYLFTGLSTEAIKQTGFGRGLIHLIPLAIVLVTLLLKETIEIQETQGNQGT